jgi:acetyl-CoA carboxylase biotin carboxyl carrier protein
VNDEADALLASSGVSAQQLIELLALLAATDITELDLSLGGTRLSLRRAPAPRPASPAEAVVPSSAAQPLAIASPLVGIFHPAVGIGDTVAPGQSIGAIEALGMPTSVEAPHSGTVDVVLVDNGSPVEYGQPLVVLSRDA